MKKNKIVLVNPAIHFQGPLNYGMYPNTAIMVLATILHNSGFQVKVIDGKYQKIDDAIRSILSEIDENLLFIGFSIMTIQLPWAYYVSQVIKSKYPNAFIVWGGVHPTLFPEQTIEDSAVDMVVVNDAASTISALSLKLSEGSDLPTIPGIFYKNNAQIISTAPNQNKDNFSNTPFINFSLINHKCYSGNNNIAIEDFYGNKYRNSRVYPITVGLGCSYQCTFCINTILKKQYLYREAREVVERIKFLQKDYGADFIHTMDENFFINRKRTFEFLDLLEKENLHIKWRPQTRADYFNDDYINVDVVKRLERSGMIVAAMGVESASPWVLDKLKKNLKVEQIIKAAEILSKTNIVPKMNFMVGIPGESQADIEKTYQLAMKIRKMAKKSCVTVVPFKPYPGSQLYDEIVSEYGYSPPSNLRDWAKLSKREFVESVGYESFENYKWIENIPRLKTIQYVYNQIAWYNPRIYGRIRSSISFIRFRFNFFFFLFFEKRFFGRLSKIKSFIDQLRYAMAKNLIRSQ